MAMMAALPAAATPGPSLPAPWVASGEVGVTLLTSNLNSLDSLNRIIHVDVDVYLEATAGAVGQRVGFYLDGGMSSDWLGQTPLTWEPAAARFTGGVLTATLTTPDSAASEWPGPFFDLGVGKPVWAPEMVRTFQVTLAFATDEAYLDWKDSGTLDFSAVGVTSPVPEATSAWMLGAGLLAIGLLWRRRGGAAPGR